MCVINKDTRLDHFLVCAEMPIETYGQRPTETRLTPYIRHAIERVLPKNKRIEDLSKEEMLYYANKVAGVLAGRRL